MANVEGFKRAGKFLNFVDDIRNKFPKVGTGGVTFQSSSNPIADMWNGLGQNYLHQETKDALKATMYLLQASDIDKVAGQTRWLSLGSGPGWYEFFLAKQLNRVKIDSLDISMGQLRTSGCVGNYLIEGGNEESIKRVRLLNASMDKLPLASGQYDRVLLINSLPWCENWRQAISEVSRVLNKQRGKVYAMIGSASILTNGNKISVTPDLSEDTFICGFEENGLIAKYLVQVHIPNGQNNMPTPRMFGVFERGRIPKEAWADRIISGRIRFEDLTVYPNGEIKVENYRRK